MPPTEIIGCLKTYFAREVLAGKDIGLDETTPLLEWNIINSLEIVRLLSFIRKEFSVDVPPHKLVADRFATLTSIAALVVECQATDLHSGNLA